jgi:hypothetical protein
VIVFKLDNLLVVASGNRDPVKYRDSTTVSPTMHATIIIATTVRDDNSQALLADLLGRVGSLALCLS